MHMNYLRAARVNDIVHVETECKKVGSTLAFLEATITNANTGKLIATATHTKYVGDNM